MKTNVSSAKGAQAKAVVLTGNGVSNKQEEATAPLLLLPIAPVTKEVEKVEPKQEAKPTEIENQSFKEEVRQQEAPTAPKRLSIDELTDKADRIYLLRQKFQTVREKRKQLEGFAISHEKDNAQLTLVDANGLTITTSNPVAIGKLLADWMKDINENLERVESEIRTELENLN